MPKKRILKTPVQLDYFPFFAKNWLASPTITCMTPEEEGAYIRLLAHCWDSDDCSLPGDDKSLAILSRLGDRWHSNSSATTTRNLVRECFVDHPLKQGWLTNKKLWETREKILNRSSERVRAGRKGAKIRWNNDIEEECQSYSSAIAEPMANDSILNLKLKLKPKLKLKDIKSKIKNSPALENSSRERGDKSEAVGAETWRQYSNAYVVRYTTPPVRNHKVNSELKKLVELLGAEEAPLVAAFYLTCSSGLYVAARHPTNLLVRDASGLRTQWATNTRATRSEARTAETSSNMNEQLKRILKQPSEKTIIDITPTTEQEQLTYEGT